MGELMSVRTPRSAINPSQARELFGVEDPTLPQMAGEYSAPMNGSVQGQTAAGPTPIQAGRTFSSEFPSLTNTDTILYTVPNISTTLSGASVAGKQTVTLASATGIIPGFVLTFNDGVNTTENVLVEAVNQSSNTVTATFTYPHNNAATVTCSRTLFITDVVATTSSTSQIPYRLKARTTLSTAVGSTGSHAVTFNNPDINAQYGDVCFVGQTVYMEDPSNASYEAVTVTAVSRNGAGVVTGFTATFGLTHSSGDPVSFPIYVAYLNNTKGLEVIGQETQTHVPPGMSLAMHCGAVTGEVMSNVAGFEQ